MNGERGVRLLGAGEVRALASRLGVRPTKKLGQNFVVEPATVRQIAALAGPFSPGDVILEVGPGLGSLTLALLEAASGTSDARLVAVEIDPVLAAELPKTIAGRAPALVDRVRVIEADALTVDPEGLITFPEEHGQGVYLREDFRPARAQRSAAEQARVAGRAAEGERGTSDPSRRSPAGASGGGEPGPGGFAGPGRRSRMRTAGVPEPGSGGSKGGGAPLGSTILAANLPYNVAVPVVLHLLAAFGSIRRGVVMVQAEVADRMCAGPGSRVYGVPSAKLAWYARARLAGTVPRTVFWPVPNVDSKLVAFERQDSPVAGASRAEVFAVIDAAFGQRRKTLRAALSGWAGSPAEAERVLRAAGVDPGARGESLGITEFARIGAVAQRTR